MRRAKIVCTLGPASDAATEIRALAEAGMSVARLNASHGTPEERRDVVDRIRAVDEETERPVAAMLDLAGPEVRTGTVDGEVTLQTGSTVRFGVGDTADADFVGLSRSIAAGEPGDWILLDDGRIETRVDHVDGETVVANIVSGGELTSNRGVNVPGVDLGLPTLTDDDRRELDVVGSEAVDFVAASFVRDRESVLEVNAALEARDLELPVVAKIERADAVANLDGIVEAADGVMVARGDLGVECPLEHVPMIQKRIIRECQRAGVPVITATEMLDSMVHARRPTRAEASDVANAVLDGTDAVMLSAETAVGDHPVRVVETMDRIVRDVEDSDEYAGTLERQVPDAGDSRTDALARSARYLADDVDATALVAATESGYTAQKAAKYRPRIPIVAATPREDVRRRLALTWGVAPRPTPYVPEGADAVIRTAVQQALETPLAESGDTVVVLAGMMTEADGLDTSNTLKVHVASKAVTTGRTIVSGVVTGPLAHSGDGDLSAVPDGAVVAVPADFDGPFDGDTDRLAGLVTVDDSVTGYTAIVARELGIPMVGDASLDDMPAGTVVTLDGERGVVYEGAVRDGEDER